MQPVGMIPGTRSRKNLQVRKMLSTGLDDAHGLIFPFHRENQNFGVFGTGGHEKMRAGRIAVVTFQTDASQKINMVAVPFQNGGHTAGTSEETSHGVSETSESCEKHFGLIIFNIVGAFVLISLSGADTGENDLLNEN